MCRVCLIALLMLQNVGIATAAESWRSLRWEHRLVICHLDGEDSLSRLRASWDTYDAEIEDRRLVFLVCLGEQTLVYGIALSEERRERLRQDILDTLAGSSYALIGLDGGVKARYEASEWSLRDVFRRIDVMPMRQAELLDQGSGN